MANLLVASNGGWTIYSNETAGRVGSEKPTSDIIAMANRFGVSSPTTTVTRISDSPVQVTFTHQRSGSMKKMLGACELGCLGDFSR